MPPRISEEECQPILFWLYAPQLPGRGRARHQDSVTHNPGHIQFEAWPNVNLQTRARGWAHHEYRRWSK